MDFSSYLPGGSNFVSEGANAPSSPLDAPQSSYKPETVQQAQPDTQNQSVFLPSKEDSTMGTIGDATLYPFQVVGGLAQMGAQFLMSNLRGWAESGITPIKALGENLPGPNIFKFSNMILVS